ncbi:hypothetical protein PG990_008654 [Apiospora arundinis]
MASLTRLPPELSLQVFSHLSLRDKVRLSAATKDYRALFAPEIFATVAFINADRVAQSALAAVKVYGKYTTRIEFGPELIAQISDEDRINPEDKLTSPVLLPAAAELLQGRHTPNLQAAQIHFDFEFDVDAWDDDGEGFSIYTFEEPEDEGRTRDKEEYWEWRALMNETWQALSSNPHVKDLTIKEFVPRWTSAFRADDFRSFLGRLESAHLSILGMDNGAGWKTNTVEGYVIFLAEDLDQAFFHHMHNLRRLAIHASDEGPLGCEGFRHIPLALKPDDLPVLHSLTLSNCFVGPELVDFIRSHAQTLTSLDVGGCVSAGDGSGMAENPLYWAEFFDQVYGVKPALTELIVGGARAPLTREENYDHYANEEEEPEVREIRQKLKADSGLKLFSYCSLDDKYGMFFRDEEVNVEAFQRGDDQRAYERLMGLVRQNKERLGQ